MRELRRLRLFGDRSIDWKSEINWLSTVSPNAHIGDRPKDGKNAGAFRRKRTKGRFIIPSGIQMSSHVMQTEKN